jgi:hypothetical protein
MMAFAMPSLERPAANLRTSIYWPARIARRAPQEDLQLLLRGDGA